jgi:transcriptional regulator with XRE-family HTH domain
VSIVVPRELTGRTITAAVGAELRRQRKARGWSREELVALLPSGISERTLVAYEHGARQLTMLRLAELSWALEVDAVTVFARGLQRARALVAHVSLAVDLRELLRDSGTGARFPPMIVWARNALIERPGGVVEVEPAVVRNLALFVGCTHSDLAHYLAEFAPEDSVLSRQPNVTAGST